MTEYILEKIHNYEQNVDGGGAYLEPEPAIDNDLDYTEPEVQSKFSDLEDFTGATAHTSSCLLMPLIIYLRVFWKSMSVYDKAASMIVIVVCAFADCYAMIQAGKELFTPSDDDTLFPYCDAEVFVPGIAKDS